MTAAGVSAALCGVALIAVGLTRNDASLWWLLPIIAGCVLTAWALDQHVRTWTDAEDDDKGMM